MKTDIEQWMSKSQAFVFVFNMADLQSLHGVLYFRNELVKVKKAQGIDMSSVPLVVVGTNGDHLFIFHNISTRYKNIYKLSQLHHL
jgi:hypothetical protein